MSHQATRVNFCLCCCNLSGGVALIMWFTTNGMCAKNRNTYAWREKAIIIEIRHSAKLCAHAAWDFRSQQCYIFMMNFLYWKVQQLASEIVIILYFKNSFIVTNSWWYCRNEQSNTVHCTSVIWFLIIHFYIMIQNYQSSDAQLSFSAAILQVYSFTAVISQV